VSGYGTVVHRGTIAMVRGVGVLSGRGVVVMGICDISMLYFQEMGKPELSPHLEAIVTHQRSPREWYAATMTHREPFPGSQRLSRSL
jgi:hypothetical protein